MLAEEPIPGGYLEDSMEAPRAVGEQQSSVEVPATHFTATEDQSHQDEFEEAQDDSSPFTACSRRGRKSSRKRPRLSRKQVKDEVTEQIPGVTSEAAAEAAVGPPSAPYPTPQGVCMQNAQWLPLQQKNEPMELRGPIGAAEGPPTEAEVRALISFLIRKPLNILKLAPCLMQEVERAWWRTRQQQQQGQEGQLQQQNQIKGLSQLETSEQSDGLIKQDLSASPIEGLTGGAPVDAADTSQSPSAASASACGISTFAAAESYAGEADAAAASASSRSTLDSSPKLAVEGGPAGPPVGHPPGPGMPHMRPRVASTGPPPLEWIGG
ncbi:uncharacterized protein LOC34621095 [Cyclospora cayetanensis]|uniref:Uncharacterized protein LOC34621095 n=1 Tax=Cyclospora cayetanensis TaxID=88456 RepID=A0A6P6RSK6_9EIME|nr:uncharacterized protein LOC34621095 [Cyclospora cayetanensis]